MVDFDPREGELNTEDALVHENRRVQSLKLRVEVFGASLFLSVASKVSKTERSTSSSSYKDNNRLCIS